MARRQLEFYCLGPAQRGRNHSVSGVESVYNWFHNRFSVRSSFFFRFFQITRTLLLMIPCASLTATDGHFFRQFFSIFTTWNIRELVGGQLLNIGSRSPTTWFGLRRGPNDLVSLRRAG